MINTDIIQPQINIGLVGHVDHGKTTLTKLLSGVWTDTHSEEIRRGITIKLGYTNFTIFKDKNGEFSITKTLENTEINKFSIVDAPGHESFMATMINGASVMDYALLLVDSSEKCPQPQTIEHIKALEIAGIKKIIVIQNKIDLITRENAIKNKNEIETFLKTTQYENSLIIPLSAQHGSNLSVLLKYINEEFLPIERENDEKLIFNIVRSFDVNKPGSDYSSLKGGVLGVSIKKGTLKIGDEIEIKPGNMKQMGGKIIFEPIYAKVEGLKTDKITISKAYPGGSIGILTKLDPNLTKTDTLVGQIGGLKNELEEISYDLSFNLNLFKTVIVNNEDIEVKPLILNEPLMLIVNSLTTIGIVQKANPASTIVKLKRPIIKFKEDRVVIFRQIMPKKWKIIGYGIITD